MQYHPPYGVSDPNAGYVNGDPSQGLAGSIPPAEAIEYPQREIVNLIMKGGYNPSDTDLFQMTRGVRRAAYAFATDTGSQNALSIAVDPPITAYEQGTELRVLCAYDNTGPSTIRVNGLSVQQIVRKDGTPLTAGDLRQGGIAVIVYDGANFQLVSGTTGNVTVTGGWFNGADYIVDVGTPNHIIGSPPIAPTAYAPGQGFTILVKNRNTGPVDINVNNLGAIPLKLPGLVDLSAGDIMPNMLIRVWYDGTNFKMLSPIWMERIAGTVQYVVGPNAGADFTDLNAAMQWLQRRRIADNGALTFMLQGATSGPALIHTYNVSILVEHPDGDKLTIAGPAPVAIPRKGNFTTTGYSAGPINNDANNNVTMLRNNFRAEIRLAATSGGLATQFTCRGNIGLITNLLITGGATMGSGPPQQNLMGIQGGKVRIQCVAAAISSGCTWYIDTNATLYGQDFYAVGSQGFSVGMSHNSNLLMGNDAVTGQGSFIVAGAYVDGVQATMNAVLQFSGVSDRGTFYSIGQFCMNHWGGSAFHVQNAWCLYCAWGLVQISGASTNYSATSQISYSNNCITCSQGAYTDFSNGYGAAIGGYSHFAAHLAGIYAAGFQGSWVTSPARNSFGNGGGYIEG